jgi:ribosomal protein S18 acetylase RimI-like enzyme
VRIREFRFPEDLPQVMQLWESIEKGVNLGRSDEVAEIEKKLQRDPDLFLIAEVETEIVGTVIGGFDGRRGLIYHLAVSDPYREQGIGTRLMETVETRLRSKGCIRCYLLVTKDNEEAMRYYQGIGWERMDFVIPFAKNLE